MAAYGGGMVIGSPPDSLPRGRRLIATLMVVLGAYIAFGTLVSPIGPDPAWTILWLFEGIAALGTAAAGIGLLKGRPGATTLGIVTVSAWLVASVALAAVLGFMTSASPVTVGVTAFQVIALVVLVRRRT